jgi:hypothetical protein
VNPDFLRFLADELFRLVRPVVVATADEGQLAAYLEQHGWVVAPADLDAATAASSLAIAGDLSAAAQMASEIVLAPEGAVALDDYIGLVTSLQALIVTLTAAATNPAPTGVPQQAWSQVGDEMAERLVAAWLENYHPGAMSVLLALGVIVEELVDVGNTPGRVNYRRPVVDWERLPNALTNPTDLVKEVYGWGSATGLDTATLLHQLERSLQLGGLPASLEVPSGALLDDYFDSGSTHRAQARRVRVPIIGDDPPSQFEIALWVLPIPPAGNKSGSPDGLVISHEAAMSLAAPPEAVMWPFTVELAGELLVDDLVRLELHPDSAKVELATGSVPQINAYASLSTGQPKLLFGSELSNALIAAPKAGFGVAGPLSDPDFRVDLAMEQGRVLIDIGEGDGFLQKLLGSAPQEVAFDVALSWSSKTGLAFKGKAVLKLEIPINKELFILYLRSMSIALAAGTDGAGITLGVTADVKLGPLAVSVEEVGVIVTFQPVPAGQPPGMFGNLDLGFGFKPPSGAGLALTAGPVGGGGYLFFDPMNEQYAGVLQLDFKAISLKAIGLLTTRMPDGSKGFSLLIIITAEFPPIQLGFGFTLNGVGGLVGINRTLVVDVLRAGIKTGAVGSILFPKDPVANAPQLLSDLRAIFPPAPDRVVFGPMAKLGWGSPTLISLELGIIIELPSPVVLVILGRLSMVLPDKEAPVLSLNMDVLGIVEFEKGEASLDATLFDSRLVAFTLTGDMALRAGWGAQPHFELSVGGFHPRFEPPPKFPALDRLALTLADSDNPRLRLECYFALTSNSLQMGARLDFHVHVDIALVGNLSVDAYLGFDVLLRFTPFSLEADMGASVSLKRNGSPLMAIELDLHLTGPGPWHAWGKALFDFLGKREIPVDVTFGDQAPPAPLPESRPQEELERALTDPGNWSAQLPQSGGMLVTLRELKPAQGELLTHPFGEIAVRQRVVPLGVTIQKYGASVPVGPRRFDITAVSVGGTDVTDSSETTREHFAPGQFFELSDAEKLSRPGFEAMGAGTRFGAGGLKAPTGVETNFGYEDIVIDVEPNTGFRQRRPGAPRTYTPRAAVVSALGQTGTVAPDKDLAIALAQPVYAVASTGDLTEQAALGATVADELTYTEAAEVLRAHIAQKPGERHDVQVVASHEVVPA